MKNCIKFLNSIIEGQQRNTPYLLSWHVQWCKSVSANNLKFFANHDWSISFQFLSISYKEKPKELKKYAFDVTKTCNKNSGVA